jgi:NAD(P)H-dependent FMN reductase
MVEASLRILAVVGTLQRDSTSSVVIELCAALLRKAECVVDVLDFKKEPLALFDPDTTYQLPGYTELQGRVDRADVIILATPDYHGSVSGAMKNFLDHFWREFAGKLFATIVASPEKGLTVTDQLRTIARQCYAWTLPYGLAFNNEVDVAGGRAVSETLQKRLEMMARDVSIYGKLLAGQRRFDLAATEPGFLARYRKSARKSFS